MNGGPNMLYPHFTQELTGLQDVIITKVENTENEKIIYAELERKQHHCIHCGAETNTVHDYRKQVIKDISAFGKMVSIILRKQHISSKVSSYDKPPGCSCNQQAHG